MSPRMKWPPQEVHRKTRVTMQHGNVSTGTEAIRQNSHDGAVQHVRIDPRTGKENRMER